MAHNCPPLAGAQGVEKELGNNAEKHARRYSEDGRGVDANGQASPPP